MMYPAVRNPQTLPTSPLRNSCISTNSPPTLSSPAHLHSQPFSLPPLCFTLLAICLTPFLLLTLSLYKLPRGVQGIIHIEKIFQGQDRLHSRVYHLKRHRVALRLQIPNKQLPLDQNSVQVLRGGGNAAVCEVGIVLGGLL